MADNNKELSASRKLWTNNFAKLNYTPLQMLPGDCPVFSADTAFHYLAEGAANIVYKIDRGPATPEASLRDQYGDGTPPPSSIDPDPTPLTVHERKLLRVRKDLPTTAPCAVAQDAWLRLIAPLFPEHQIVCQSLVELRSAKVIHRLNEELRARELPYPKNGSVPSLSPRPTKRRGVYLADDEHGLLVTDMTPALPGEDLLEFKPKWLLQSPSAPKNSKRCRQCARIARVNAERSRNREPLAKSYCPLDLTAKSHHDVLRVASQILDPELSEHKIRRLAKWIETTDLLERLKSYQGLLDEVGVMEGDVNDTNFLTAMTLRDCTVFVRFPEDESATVEARIGDLDLKSKEKVGYWRSVERQLIEEGWYEGSERKEDWQPLTCKLSPQRYEPGNRGPGITG